MGTCTINGKQVEFSPGEPIIKAAKRAGMEIPHYCYHEGLSIVAQCRMCLVEVEGQRKLLTACSTPCAEGMKVSTQSPSVKTAVAGVQEFLLANHPLDCPICDQAGECSLQKYSLKHGAPDSRYDFFRRTYIDVDMGPVIKKNMNRCIHCTRCIRYCDEIGKIHEMVAVERGNNLEIVTVDDKALQTAYAGGLADVCPVGSLTTKDFRFTKRVWYLRNTASVCDGCSQGCNINVAHERGVAYRLQPRENQEINKWWMCDEGRIGFHYVHSPSRVLGPVRVDKKEKLEGVLWGDAVSVFQGFLAKASSVGFLVCADITTEEAMALQKAFPKSSFYSHSPTVDASDEDEAVDHLLRRKDKSPNLHGLEALEMKTFSKFDPSKYDVCVFVSGGKVRVPYGLAKLAKHAVGMGVFMKEELLGFDLVLPIPSWLEKSGSYTNHQGKKQIFKAAIQPLGMCKPVDQIIKSLTHETRKVG